MILKKLAKRYLEVVFEGIDAMTAAPRFRYFPIPKKPKEILLMDDGQVKKGFACPYLPDKDIYFEKLKEAGAEVLRLDYPDKAWKVKGLKRAHDEGLYVIINVCFARKTNRPRKKELLHWLEEAITEYDRYVDGIQIWNEFDHPFFSHHPPEKIIELLNAGSKLVERYGKDVYANFTTMPSWNPKFLRIIPHLRDEIKIGLDFYLGEWQIPYPGMMYRVIGLAKEVLRERNKENTIVISEMGVTETLDSPKSQAKYILSGIDAAKAMGVKEIMIYTLFDPVMIAYEGISSWHKVAPNERRFGVLYSDGREKYPGILKMIARA